MKALVRSIVFLSVAISALGSAANHDGPNKDIIDTAISAGQFTTLVSLIQKSGLVEVLRAPQVSYTVFAPTDAAFSRIPASDLNALLANPDALKKVLLQHIGLGVYPSALLKLGLEPSALSGGRLVPGFDNGVFEVNFANVLLADVFATNGVIHAIDAVIGVTTNND
jgi:uncharacterized surface protein with fasciclin (FAS1) repeats